MAAAEELAQTGECNADDIYSGFVLCLDGTSNRCNNTTNHTKRADFDFELIMNCRYYLEGIALTPISIFGMLGKFIFFSLKNFCLVSNSHPNKNFY